MSVVATFTAGRDELPLGRILASNARVELETTIPLGERMLPYFWVSGRDADEVREALAGAQPVEAFEVVHESDAEALFSVEWVDDVGGLLAALREYDAVVVEGSLENNEWRFRIRFPDNDTLSAFYRTCIDRGVDLELARTQQSATSDRQVEYGLTEEQYRTLVTAAQRGYFEVPRRSSMREIADQLGVSDSAVSQRLRRGLSSLLSTALLDRTSESEDDD